jgi:hypothetical protein
MRDLILALESLRRQGLIPAANLKEIVLASSKRTFKFTVPGLFEANFERQAAEQGLQIPFAAERLKVLAQRVRGPNRHLLVIDGLDDILTQRVVQYQALAALVLEVSRLNLSFQRAGVPMKIILLCRTDLYEKLPGPNKNKIRQDGAIILDWYHDPRRPKESGLVRLANLRAKLADESIDDIFARYFPAEIENKEIRLFLLDLTRHTPRDFLQLCRFIQNFSDGRTLTRAQILSGVRQYSIEYFVPEIKDELVGYVEPAYLDTFMELLGTLRKREFHFGELAAACLASGVADKLNLRSLVTSLFDCSAIGNVQPRPGGSFNFTFRFRNRNSTINFNEGLILHRGMWKALNLI